MRQLVAGLLVASTIAICSPLVAAGPSAATLLGQLVDAGGRGEVGQPVELIRDGVMITTTVTAANGEFIFANIAPGSYVVRTTMNHRAAGTKVTVSAGESLPVTVVLPSLATASPVVGPAISLFLTQIVTVTGTAIVSPLFTNSQKLDDAAFLQSVNPLLYQSFMQNIGDQLSLTANDVGRIFKIGPYSTF